MSDDTRWRLLLGLGAVPSTMVVALSIAESRIKQRHRIQQHLKDSAENGDADSKGLSSSAKFPERDENLLSSMLRERETWFNLIATGGGWFIYDVAYCKTFVIASMN